MPLNGSYFYPVLQKPEPNSVVTRTTANKGSVLSTTPQVEVDAQPRVIDHTLTFTVTSGSSLSFNLNGFSGKGNIVLEGVLQTYTPSAGVSSGLAASGSTSTAIKKPAASASWAASELRGKFVKIIAGTGEGAIRPVLSSSTDTLVVHAIAGLDTTSEFQLLESVSTIDAVNISGCLVPVTVRNLNVDTLTTNSNREVVVRYCLFTGSLESDIDKVLTVEDCILSKSALLDTEGSLQVSAERLFVNDGSCSIKNAHKVTTNIEALNCSAEALYISATKANVGLNAINCSGSAPLMLVNANSVEPYGSVGIAGSGNGAANYGIWIEGNTHVDLVGYTTLAGGTADLYVDGDTESYTNISNAGGGFMSNRASVIVSNGTGLRTKKLLTVQNDIITGGSTLLYGLRREQFTEVTATGTEFSDAHAGGILAIDINGGAADTGVKLWATPAIAGLVQHIRNSSGSNKKIYPGNASHTINGGSAGAAVDLADGESAMFISTSATNWARF